MLESLRITDVMLVVCQDISILVGRHLLLNGLENIVALSFFPTAHDFKISLLLISDARLS